MAVAREIHLKSRPKGMPTHDNFELVTRDLFYDFGEFTLTGLGFSPVDGQSALFDHLYLARSAEELDLIKVEKGGE